MKRYSQTIKGDFSWKRLFERKIVHSFIYIEISLEEISVEM